MAVQSNKVYPPPLRRGFYFCVSGAADKRYSLGVMRTGLQVTFTSDFFKPIAGEDEANPGRFGKTLALWLAAQLKERGVAVEGVIPEDFGWVMMVSHKPFRLWLGCGNTDGSTTEWNVFPVAELSTLQRVCKRGDPSADIEKLRAHLVELVASIPKVTNVVWN